MGDEEPLGAVRAEADGGSEEEDEREREVEEGEARGPAESLAEVGRGGQVVKLHLRYPHGRLQIRRISRKVEVGSRERLDPHRRHQYHPLPRLPPHHRPILHRCRRSPFSSFTSGGGLRSVGNRRGIWAVEGREAKKTKQEINVAIIPRSSLI